MYECLVCGKVLPRKEEKGHREREYCSSACRRRAYRKRNRWRYNLTRARQEARVRMINSIDQDIHRETWQDELERANKRLEQQEEEIAYLQNENDYLQLQLQMRDDWIDALTNQIAEKEAEIVRLIMLLDQQSKRR